MTLHPSLLHDELARERSREGRRRAAGARRLARKSLPPTGRAMRTVRVERGGDPCEVAPAAAAPVWY